MGYFGKIKDKQWAQRLRKEGLSYREIVKRVHVSKDSVSRWCRDIPLTGEQEQRLLNNKLFGQKKGSIVAANRKRLARIQRTKEISRMAKKEVGKLGRRDRFIAGIALYAAEGDKTDGKGGLSNTDPRIVRFMANWFREFAGIPDSRLRGAIWIHEGLDQLKAKTFWSEQAGIPESQFHKTYAVRIKRGKRIRKNIHEYGVFSVRFSDSARQRKIMGWISAILDDKIHQKS